MVDKALVRIGSEQEAEAARFRLSSAAVIETSGRLIQQAQQFAVRPELRPEDRLAMAYAQGDAQRAVEGARPDGALALQNPALLNHGRGFASQAAGGVLARFARCGPVLAK
jgi:hypothetical protein